MYNNFAYIYDRLMYDVDYKKWVDYIETLIKENDIKASSILDLGCGTGNFSIEMSKRNYEVIGVDISADMLACAKEKALKENQDILFLNQDMSNFELYGTVDVIICLMDSLNYLTIKNDVKRLFKLVKNYLNPGGLFIFDINSCYKLENILGDNVFYDIGKDITYIWQNAYDKKKKLCEFELTFFVNEGEKYQRYEEVHYERAYETKELKALLKTVGLDVLKVYDNLTLSLPKPKSERIFFVCKKGG